MLKEGQEIKLSKAGIKQFRNGMPKLLKSRFWYMRPNKKDYDLIVVRVQVENNRTSSFAKKFFTPLT